VVLSLLFIFDVAIWDMPLAVAVGILLNYADDSSSLLSAPRRSLLYSNAQTAARLMAVYCDLNFLNLNSSKSVIMQYRHPNSTPIDCSPYVTVDGKSVSVLDTTKLLGLYLAVG
jgi:hypothetical protein